MTSPARNGRGAQRRRPAPVAPAPATPAPRTPGPFYKTCPRCGSVLFADMDTCYECLYDFTNPGLDYPGSGARPDVFGGVPMVEPAMGTGGPEGRVPSEADGRPFAVETEAMPPMGTPTLRETGPQRVTTPEPAPEPLPEPSGAAGHPDVPEPDSDAIRIDGERTEYVANERVRDGEPGQDADGASDGGDEPIDRSQDAGLFAKPSKGAPPRRETGEVELGVLVRWRGLEMTAGFHGDRLAIGRDRANDIAIASFDVPAFAVEIERRGEGAELRLLAEGIGATLDDEPFGRSTRMAAGQEVELFGARLSLVRMDR